VTGGWLEIHLPPAGSLDGTLHAPCSLSISGIHLLAIEPVVLPRGSRSEEKVLPGVCVRQRGPPSRVNLGFLLLGSFTFLFLQIAIVSKIGRKTVLCTRRDFCSPM